MEVKVVFGNDSVIVSIVDGGCTRFMWWLELLMVMIVGVLPLGLVMFSHLFVAGRDDYDDDIVRFLLLLMVVSRFCLWWSELLMVMIG